MCRSTGRCGKATHYHQGGGAKGCHEPPPVARRSSSAPARCRTWQNILCRSLSTLPLARCGGRGAGATLPLLPTPRNLACRCPGRRSALYCRFLKLSRSRFTSRSGYGGWRCGRAAGDARRRTGAGGSSYAEAGAGQAGGAGQAALLGPGVCRGPQAQAGQPFGSRHRRGCCPAACQPHQPGSQQPRAARRTARRRRAVASCAGAPAGRPAGALLWAAPPRRRQRLPPAMVRK